MLKRNCESRKRHCLREENKEAKDFDVNEYKSNRCQEPMLEPFLQNLFSVVQRKI